VPAVAGALSGPVGHFGHPPEVAPPRVELANVSKRYGERIALRRVDLTVEPGERIALVGANGSGKSTLLRIVAGLTRATAGVASIDGTDVRDLAAKARGRIAYVAHRSLAYPALTARENLELVAHLHRVPGGRIEAALDRVGLAGRGDDRLDGFSRGMSQRLALARVVLTDPTLVLFDEAATGLDEEGQALLGELLDELRGRATILFTTHDRRDTSRADRIVRLLRGERVPDEAAA
jgi:heme exporter protein A